MHTGMKRGARGDDVARLQRVLTSAGHRIDSREIAQREVGPSTLAALHQLQQRHGLPAADEIDETTLAVLIELEQNITININQPPGKTPHPDGEHGKVWGTLVDGDGIALPGHRVAVFAKSLRSEAHIGDGETSAFGAYSVSYRRRGSLNLLARAYDAKNVVVAESATEFGAPAQVEIDLTTAKDGVCAPLRSSPRSSVASAPSYTTRRSKI